MTHLEKRIKTQKNHLATRELAIVIVACLLTTYIALVLEVNATNDNTLSVYIGAHPDDIDIGMSGSLYKNDLNKHPILWIVATDGGADKEEYNYDTFNGWVKQDAVCALWAAPNGDSVTREFYSQDLTAKRCGIGGSYQHPYLFTQSYDWKTRVALKLGTGVVEKIQLSYTNPTNPSAKLLYPDGALQGSRAAYTTQLAMDIAYETNRVVSSRGYRKIFFT